MNDRYSLCIERIRSATVLVDKCLNLLNEGGDIVPDGPLDNAFNSAIRLLDAEYKDERAKYDEQAEKKSQEEEQAGQASQTEEIQASSKEAATGEP